MSVNDRRDWNWDRDGALQGHYVETREIVVKNGPSAGKAKLVFDFHVGLEDEFVSVWETAVLRSKFREELRARRKPDFEAGEQFKLTPLGLKESANGHYRDFEVWFEHAAPKRTAAELLADEGLAEDENVPLFAA